MRFEISFSGHENIRSLHPNTIEVTRDADLTPSGDCIVGTGAAAACRDLPAGIRRGLRDPGSVVRFGLVVGGSTFSFSGRGHPELELSHPRDMVIRRSGFVCPRTLAVGADKASDSIPREMVRRLRDPGTVGRLVIEVPG